MSALNLTKSLATDPRASLEPWLEEIETHDRNLCAEHDVTGALTLVAADDVWNIIVRNLNLYLILKLTTVLVVTYITNSVHCV